MLLVTLSALYGSVQGAYEDLSPRVCSDSPREALARVTAACDTACARSSVSGGVSHALALRLAALGLHLLAVVDAAELLDPVSGDAA